MALTKAQINVVSEQAFRLGISTPWALAVVDKESAGRAFYTVKGEKLPSIRIEGHYFWRLLGPGPKRDRAVREGLANRKAGVVKNPSTMAGRYAMLDRMTAIDVEVAYQSISIAIGQVMGENFKRIGYQSATAMFQAATASFDNQAAQMLSFIATDRKLVAAIQNHDYHTYARIYNGPNYKANNYHTDLKAFVEKWEALDGDYSGSRAAPTIDWASRIKVLGFSSVRAFQTSAGLTVDGIVGPITKEAILNAEAEYKKRNNAAIVTAGKAAGGAVIVGTGTIAAQNSDSIGSAVETIEAVKPAIDTIQSVSSYGTTVVIVVVVGIVLIAGFVAIKQWLKNRDHKGT